MLNSETLITLKLKITSNKLTKFKGIARVLITHLDFLYLAYQINKKIIK